MRWIGWLLHNKYRRLEVSLGGRWFLAFTIVLGVVAINSANNVIYLLESLLLSSLIFSGILSEMALTRVRFRRVTRQAVARERAGDELILTNLSRLPLYCLELGEWDGKKFVPLAFVLQVSGRSEVRVRTGQKFPVRGRHDWSALALGTSFPFGFARKVRILPDSGGSRIVWPAGIQAAKENQPSRRGEWEPADGELQEMEPWDDMSRVHWPSTARAGRLLARPRVLVSEEEEVFLRLEDRDPEREMRISSAAGRFLANARTLWVRQGTETLRVEGAWRCLDTLALLPREEK